VTLSWESAYFATSALLGEPLEASIASLGEAGPARAAELVEALRSPSREVRALALARAVSDVARAVDAMGLG
jgi:hypothetical protein